MDEWECDFEAEEAAFLSEDGFHDEPFLGGGEHAYLDLRTAGPTEHPERSPGFRNFRHGSDLGAGATNEEGLRSGFNAEETGSREDRSRRRQTEEEEEKQGQKKGALNRSRKSGKKKKKQKEKEEGRKSIAGVISGSIQKFFGRSSNCEGKETIHGIQSNTTEAEKHRQTREANDDDDDYDDDYDDDDDDNEGSMWSDSEFDEEYDDEVYSNVDELGGRFDSETKIEKRETTTTTTTTKSSSAPTKATVTTTYDLITFEPENEDYEVMKVEEKSGKETFPDTEMNRSSAANSNGKVLVGVLLGHRRDVVDTDLSKNTAHVPSSRVDKDRLDQETDQMPSIQSARRLFQVENKNFKKSTGNELGKNKNEIQNFGSKNAAKSDSTHVKCVTEKQDHLDFTKNKKISSNDNNISIRKQQQQQQGEDKQQTQRDPPKTTNKSTLPTGQTCVVWSGATKPSDRFANKRNPAADLQGTAKEDSRRGSAGGEGSPSGGDEAASDVNRSKIAAVHSLVKLFDTPRPAKDTLQPPPQQRPTGGDSRRELGIRGSPALKKKPIVETPKPLISARTFTANPMDCSAPPVLPKRVVNPGKRSPPTDPGLPGSRLPPGRLTPPSAPTDIAATVNCVHRDSTSDSSVCDGNRWKRPPVKALGQALPPIPSAGSKEPPKIRAKGTGNETSSVVRRPTTSPPPVPTKSLSTDIPNSGTVMSQRNFNVNQLGEFRKNLRKIPDTGSTKYNEESLVDRSSKQPPSVPYKPQKFTTNGPVNGKLNGSMTDEKEMAEEQLERQLWYFGDSTREECDARLNSVGQNGAFVVRRSRFGGEKCPYTLSVYLDQATVSMSIRRRPDNTYALGTEKSDEIVYNDVLEIVSFHRINPIRLHNGKTLRLKTSPPK